MEDKKIWFWDLETLDIFTATFKNRDTKEIKVFVISKSRDDREELFKFLKEQVIGLIGFNSIYFDAQVIEFMQRNPEVTADEIRNYAGLITSDNDRKVDVPEWNLPTQHLDLYKINHFDNKNRRTGLKWCEFMMDMDNIEDLPSQGEGNNWEEMVLSYNLNDVLATEALYYRTLPMIVLRKRLKELYHIDCLNYSNTKLGSEILLKLYCRKTGKNPRDVRALRTFRPVIQMEDVVFDYIGFKSDTFKLFYQELRKKVIFSTKKEKDDEISVRYKDFEFVYGKGGIHGSLKNAVIIEVNTIVTVLN